MGRTVKARRLGTGAACLALLFLALLALRTSVKPAHWESDPAQVWGRGRIYRLSWSPDGTTLALAGSRGLWLCDAALESCRLWSRAGGVVSVAYSSDGRYLATGNYRGDVVVWDAQAGDAPILTLSGLSGWVRGVAFSPDGAFLAGGGEDGALRVWDFPTGNLRYALAVHTGAITHMMFSPTGYMLASSGKDGRVHMWDVIAGEPGALSPDWGVPLNNLVWRSDGEQIAIVTANGGLMVWDVDGAVQWMRSGEQGEWYSVDWSRDGRRLVTSGLDGQVRLWDAQSGALLRVLSPDARAVAAMYVRFNPVSQALAIATVDGNVALWPQDGAAPQAILENFTPQVRRIALSGDGRALAVGSEGGWVSLWDWGADHPWWLQRAHAGAVTTLQFSPDHHWLITASPADTLNVWDAQTGALASTLPITLGVASAVFSPDGQWLYVAARRSPPDFSLVYSCALTRWRFASGDDVRRDDAWGDHETDSVFAAMPDGRLLLSGPRIERDQQYTLWDPAQKKALGKVSLPFTFRPTTFSQDGRWFALTPWSTEIYLYSTQNADWSGPVLRGHQGNVLSLAFSPNAQVLASGDMNGAIYLWDVNRARALLTIEGHHGAVQDLTFTPDGRFLVSGGDDNAVRVWDLALIAGPVLAPLSASQPVQPVPPAIPSPTPQPPPAQQPLEPVNSMQKGDFQRLYPDVKGVSAMDAHQDTLIMAGAYGIFHHQLSADDRDWRIIKTAKSVLDGYYFYEVAPWAVEMVAEDDFWMVGTNGQVAHFSGRTWAKVPGPTQDHLWDIQMLGPNDGWIVGEHGAIWRYRDQQWISVTAPTTDTLYAVDFVAPDEAWAAGRDGTLEHYIGGVWKRVPGPTTEHLRGLDMVSADLGWAVGAGGVILRFDGRDWEPVPSPTTANLHSVSAPSPDVAWAVGAGGVMVHWDGKAWASGPQLTKNAFWTVQMLSPDEGWAASGDHGNRDALLHFEHGAWRIVSSPLYDVSAVDMAGKTGWLFGQSISQTQIALQYVDGDWQIAPDVHLGVEEVALVGEQEAWAIGERQFYHWMDGAWTAGVTTTCKLADMALLDARAGWAVGDGCALRYTGEIWETVPFSTGWRAKTLGLVSSSEVWASAWVDGAPYLLHFKDDAWEVLENPAKDALYGFSFLPTGESWAISENRFYHLKDGRWQWDLAPPLPEDIDYLEIVSSNEGWLFSNRGNVYAYDGEAWELVLNAPSNGKWVRRPNGEFWVFGYRGIWHRPPQSK